MHVVDLSCIHQRPGPGSLMNRSSIFMKETSLLQTDHMESQLPKTATTYPPELRSIKGLYLQQQYRQCIVACRDVLSHRDVNSQNSTLHRTFVQFYLALAHDELARTIHNFSQAKVPAFNQAANLYDETLWGLPLVEDCLAAVIGHVPEATQDSGPDPKPNPRDSSAHSLASPFSPCLSPERIPVLSPRSTSPGTVNSEFDDDDLESHESFNEIMTPTRVPSKLPRDYSSVQLLQPMQRTESHSLMRPFRMGSPPKPYKSLFPATNDSNVRQRPSMLPRLNTSPGSSPVRKQAKCPSEQVSPVALPVSPLDSDSDPILSDGATISPISPETPDPEEQHPQGTSQEHYFSLVEDHLQALRVQLKNHIYLLQTAKQKTLDIQAERTAARQGSGSQGKSEPERVPQSGSYWSFTPKDVGNVEKQMRIEAGRRRGWERRRFDPSRYQELADAALAEL